MITADATAARATMRPGAVRLRLLPVLLALLVLVPAGTRGAGAAAGPPAAPVTERDVEILVPRGMPLDIDDGLFFQDGAVLTFTLRNGRWDVARARVRVFVFDEADRLKGSASFCMPTYMQPGTRQRVNFSVEVAGVTARDRYVLVLETVDTARASWRVREGMAEQIEMARRVAKFSAGILESDQVAGSGTIPDCGCACEAADALGREGCGQDGLAAFTCTPFYSGGCSLGFTCKTAR